MERMPVVVGVETTAIKLMLPWTLCLSGSIGYRKVLEKIRPAEFFFFLFYSDFDMMGLILQSENASKKWFFILKPHRGE